MMYLAGIATGSLVTMLGLELSGGTDDAKAMIVLLSLFTVVISVVMFCWERKS